MNLPETHYFLKHLPPIDQHFIDEAKNAVYMWPAVDYEAGQPLLEKTRPGSLAEYVNRGVPMATPARTQHGMNPVPGDRHDLPGKTVFQLSSFRETKFCQDIIRDLGEIKTRYLYNQPWSLYDWHQDWNRHQSCINFVLTDNPGCRTVHKFPYDCRLNYKISMTEYVVGEPVLFNAKIDHCVLNLDPNDRYILTVMLLDTTYEVAKEYLSTYKFVGDSYL